MIELLSFIYKHRHEPLGWLIIGSILVILDRLGRKFVTHQLKKVFGVEDKSEFKELIHNTKAILENQRTIMNHMGVQSWSNAELASTKENTVPMLQQCFLLIAEYLARFASASINGIKTGLSTFKKGMNTVSNINWVSLTVALLAAVKMVLQAFGYDLITDEQINSIANAVAAIAAIVGVLMSHRKGDKLSEKHFGDSGSAL